MRNNYLDNNYLKIKNTKYFATLVTKMALLLFLR